MLGTREGAGQSLRLDVVKLPTRVSLVAYLRSGWIENIDDGSIEELAINGIPAATAVTSPPVAAGPAEPLQFRIAVLKLGGEGYRFVFATRALTEDADRGFRQSIQSFRKLSEREQAVPPWLLKVIAVEPGDTVETLAARTVFADHQLERFRAVNGLEPGAELRPGDLVKIVVE